MRIIVNILITAAALWVAAHIVSGIQSTSGLGLIGVAIVFGVVNVIIKPVLKILSLPFIILTLGFFTLIINALMLWLTSALSGDLGLGFHVNGFMSAFLGALVVSVVSFALSILAPD